MSNQEDPYETLGVPRNAKPAQIKAAYRKLALKYHPDKQSGDEQKKKSTEIFTKIGNAYEILSDPQRKAEFDRYGAAGSNFENAGPDPRGRGFNHQYEHHDNQESFDSDSFFNGGGDPFMNDPFFAGAGARGGGPRHGGFMDPFEIFKNVFGDAFDDGFGNMFDQGHMHQHMNRHMNQHMNGGADPFGGMGGMMGNHMNMMNSMMNMQTNMQTNTQSSFQRGNQEEGNGNGQFSYSSSSSSNFGGNRGGGGVSESVSTSTRIVNGKRQTVTERTIVKPDGTVERTVETTGDNDFPSPAALGYGGQPSSANNVPYLEQARGFFGGRR